MTAVLHRTPLHEALARHVHVGLVRWSSTVGASGGFVADTLTLDRDVLVALWELKLTGLLAIDPDTGLVRLTELGLQRLVEWQGGRS